MKLEYSGEHLSGTSCRIPCFPGAVLTSPSRRTVTPRASTDTAPTCTGAVASTAIAAMVRFPCQRMHDDIGLFRLSRKNMGLPRAKA